MTGPSTSTLSLRGRQLIDQPAIAEYIRAHFQNAAEAWDAKARPDGYIALCIAENRGMWEVLRPQLANYRDIPARVLGYDAMTGALEFRTKLAAFMSERVLGRRVEAEQLAALAGAGAVLEVLFYALADPGDGVLVPTPSYAGFWTDLETRDGLEIVTVPCASEDDFRLTPARLDAAMAEATVPIKALLFTTPDNPMGRVYTRAQLLEVLAWAEGAGVHVVFDEVYALSVFGERPFVSAASLRERLGPWAHVIWAFSKDFGASGLRCGVLVSENPEVLAAVDALSYWSACSGDTQYLLGELVADADFIDGYIETMRARLGQAYAEVHAALAGIGVHHLPADGGFFVLCDLRPFLDEPSFAAEHRLWRRLLDEARVNLTPGAACRVAEPGFFRLCYASEPVEALREAVARVGRVLAG
ncbi:aminotransferase class I/II-fold pyridoxal phosphate-dependent enzyme [Pseudenhygromyxa sp. WMMC2535]|uniref:aminotransferase class I/II-fold pyridoxal phosphate-dependent enzyme n=1 Tax=Pseudenhygromyxa sp. WMMC2535 TaxID=2712867 RepID=UPI0015564465|nr:aminotransferase class I/II-fold pyridoxal phosphate-dependent enzyme [Pseudenhygromyxa sp. WMMC2535]NVB36258.1 aminotransferase class I/II-fold pyridoxal phosphate-dependent enzyme [Pseudenhygromyxa sp. WMMC2535]